MKHDVVAESTTDTAMMMHIAAGDPLELMASSAEEIMPLPYWSEPIKAAAEVAAFSSAAREKRLTSAQLSELTAATPMILTPKSSP